MEMRSVLGKPRGIAIVCVVMILGAVDSHGQPHRLSAETVIDQARVREHSLKEGKITFKVSLPSYPYPYDGWEPMLSETIEPILIDYLWVGSNRFRITLHRDEHVIRTIISDGTQVDTGDGRVWDAKFLDSYPYFPYENLGYEFSQLMWPYNEVILKHMFPTTENPVFTKWLHPNYRWRLKDKEISAGRTLIERRRVENVDYELAVDPELGFMPTFFVARDRKYDFDITDRYTDPFLIGGEIWFPREYKSVTIFPNRQSRDLISQVLDGVLLVPGSIDPKEFSIDKQGSEFIIWKENPLLNDIALLIELAFLNGYKHEFWILYLLLAWFCLLFLALAMKLGKKMIRKLMGAKI